MLKHPNSNGTYIVQYRSNHSNRSKLTQITKEVGWKWREGRRNEGATYPFPKPPRRPLYKPSIQLIICTDPLRPSDYQSEDLNITDPFIHSVYATPRNRPTPADRVSGTEMHKD